MKLLTSLPAGVMMAGAAAVLLAAPPAHGQSSSPRIEQPNRVLPGVPGASLGAAARDLDAAELARTGGGIVLESVRPDGPAAKAGLRAADVVVEFDGERIRSARQFTRLVQETPPGRTVPVGVVRDGARVVLQVTPERLTWPELAIDRERIRERVTELTSDLPLILEIQGLVPGDRAGRRRLGVTVHELTPELAAYFGVTDGVLVASVAADSPAARAGLRAGDVITEAAGQTVASGRDLVHALRQAEGTIAVGIVRDRRPSEMSVELPRRRG